MRTFQALVKREILDGKNGYIYAPVILAAVTVVLLFLSIRGFGTMIQIAGAAERGIENFGDALGMLAEKQPEDISATVTVAYWSMGALPWIAFPFVVFFSLLGSLYEDRRDRSILFWKSMPVADWMEVVAKLFVPVVVVPFIYLAVVIASQLVIAFCLSFIALFQGGPVLELWPLGGMAGAWLSGLGMYFLMALWMLPLLAWVLLVSSYANRLPFLWAVLLPVVIVTVEEILFSTNNVRRWIGIQMGGWSEFAFGNYFERRFEDIRDILLAFMGAPQWHAFTYSLGSTHFWSGIIIAAGFVFVAIEIRKRTV